MSFFINKSLYGVVALGALTFWEGMDMLYPVTPEQASEHDTIEFAAETAQRFAFWMGAAYLFVTRTDDAMACTWAFATSALATLGAIVIAGFALVSLGAAATQEQRMQPLFYAIWAWWFGLSAGLYICHYVRTREIVVYIAPEVASRLTWQALRYATGSFCLLWPFKSLALFHVAQLPELIVVNNGQSLVVFTIRFLVWMAGFLSIFHGITSRSMQGLFVGALVAAISLVSSVSCYIPPAEAENYAISLDVLLGVYCFSIVLGMSAAVLDTY